MEFAAASGFVWLLLLLDDVRFKARFGIHSELVLAPVDYWCNPQMRKGMGSVFSIFFCFGC
jgi:hypothetical protein